MYHVYHHHVLIHLFLSDPALFVDVLLKAVLLLGVVTLLLHCLARGVAWLRQRPRQPAVTIATADSTTTEDEGDAGW